MAVRASDAKRRKVHYAQPSSSLGDASGQSRQWQQSQQSQHDSEDDEEVCLRKPYPPIPESLLNICFSEMVRPGRRRPHPIMETLHARARIIQARREVEQNSVTRINIMPNFMPCGVDKGHCCHPSHPCYSRERHFDIEDDDDDED